jgi:hypothetical protein
MVEGDSNLKLLPASIFHMYTVFEHINIRVAYRFGISVWTLRYFLGIYHTDTEGKPGWYFRYFKIGGSPLFPKEGGGLRPPFVHFALLLRDKMNSRQIFKKRVPAKSSKGVPAKKIGKKWHAQ